MKRKHFKASMRAPGDSRGRSRSRSTGDIVRIYGLHAAAQALSNPQRLIRRIYATPNAVQRLAAAFRPGLPDFTAVTPKELDRMLGGETVHQGVLIEASPLPETGLTDLAGARLLIVLDQITDPQNAGAILRSAAAFGAHALVMTAHHSPPLETALAKAASGGLELVPVVLVPNLARCLAELGDMGFVRLGLDSGGDTPLEQVDAPDRLALVLGAEDRGLRRLTRENCDAICALTAFGAIVSLNVSNAAAVALHHMAHKMRNRPGD